MARDGTLRIYGGSLGVRRFYGAFCALLAVYAVVVFVAGSGWNQLLAVILLVGNLPLGIRHLSYLRVDPDGITVHERVRRRHVAWSDIAVVRLRWVTSLRRPQLPEIERTDGTILRRSLLSDLRGPQRERERDDLLERLRQEADAHGFTVEVEGAD